MISSDISYESYFFRKVNNPVWFDILKDQGFFNPSKNPDPKKIEDGYQIPLWDVLNYLERIAAQVSEGKHPELIVELLTIIDEVSKQPKDNYRTWHSFIEILSYLPNQTIPLKILDHVPVWLNSQFGSDSVTSAIGRQLLPKFLNDAPTAEDIEKAEKIIKHLTGLSKIEVDSSAHWKDRSSYNLDASLYWLKSSFVDQGIAIKVARFCSNDVIFHIANNLKRLLTDHYNGVFFNFFNNGQSYHAKLTIEENDLSIDELKDDKDNHLSYIKFSFDDYLKYDKAELERLIKKNLQEHGLEYEKGSENGIDLGEAVRILYNDTSSMWCRSLHDFNTEYHSTAKETLALILKEITNQKAKHDEGTAAEIIKAFAFDYTFNLPFFKRLAIYTISENWSDPLKSIFWQMIDQEDAKQIFSSYQYRHELYHLLRQNIANFEAHERAIVKQIVENGPQDEKEERHDGYIESWKLRWYSALKEDVQFASNYTQLSAKLNRSSVDYEKEGKVQTRIGSVSPLSVQDILQMHNEEIVSYIKNFNPENRWEGPSIDGLSQAIEDAISEAPQRFDTSIQLFESVAYPYAYRMIYGFNKAWKNNKDFDWKKVLSFCLAYINSSAFRTTRLELKNDDLGAKPNWVVGAIANLIQDGTRSDNHSFPAEYLPLAKEILSKLIPQLNADDEFEKTNMDYLTYSLNSTAGKLLHALLNYSLRKARIEHGNKEGVKWDAEAQNLFEQTMQKGIIDSYILQGWYYPQFYYLNKDCIIDQTKKNYKLEDKFWRAFMEGVAIRNPMSGKDLYDLMYPHYQKAIENKLDFKGHNLYGINRHLATFFFWGYEGISDCKLITKFLNESHPKQIQSFIHFIVSQKDFMSSLEDEAERESFRSKITELWRFVLSRYQKENTKEVLELISDLSQLSIFLVEIKANNKSLFQASARVLNVGRNSHSFIEELNRLKDNGNPVEKVKYIRDIMQDIPILFWLTDEDKKRLIDLTIFLYDNKEIETANLICNKYSKEGMDFLRMTYEKYN